MYKAYKFRLYPNNQQKQKLNKTFGCNRFVYNYYLRKIISEEYINAYSCIKDYTNISKIIIKDISTVELVIQNIEANMVKIVIQLKQFITISVT